MIGCLHLTERGMLNADFIKHKIRTSFAEVSYPGDWCLRGSNEGDEPYLLEEEFKGKIDWRAIDAEFLDQAPDGFGSALSFFSDEAFRFYLPAYLIADIDGKLQRHSPVSHLTHSLSEKSKTERVNPRRYGERTWLDVARHKFAMFNREQAAAIVAYLRFKHEIDQFAREAIDDALKNFWLERAGEAR